jgi:photosystem II stability/assembly factor-like uncharacterized protein
MFSLKTILLIFIILINFLNLSCTTGLKSFKYLHQEDKWKQLPLKSLAQKKTGMSGGEGMQMIFGIAYAPSNPQIVYLLSNTSQVWKSSDSGNSWEMKHEGFLSNGGIDISVDPINEDIVFAAGCHCEPYQIPPSPADGIYRSTDGGENWKLVKSTPFFSGKEGKHFAFDVRSNDGKKINIIYAGTHQDGLLISKDGGDNWNTLGFKGERILDMAFDPINPSLLYLLTVKGLFKITIDDHVISQIEKIGEDLQGTPKTFALNLKDPLTMYIAAEEDGVFKSVDGGKKFIRLENGLLSKLNYAQIAVSSANPEYLYVSVQKWGGLNPFWSHDGGSSWHQPETLNKNNDSLRKGKYFSAPISPHPFEANIALTSANGEDRILETIDGGISWFYSNNGYTGGRKGVGTTSQAFYSDSKKTIFFLIDFGLALTLDGGETFQLLNIPRVMGFQTTPVGAVSPGHDKDIITAIGGWERQKLAVSSDNGESWRVISGTDDNYKFITFHPQKPDIIYAQRFISDDRGASWKELSQKVYALFGSNGDIVYSIDKAGEWNSIVKRSEDQGKTWTAPYPQLPVRIDGINEIVIDPLNPDRIYVASNSGLYIYDDKDKMWGKKEKESGLSRDRFGLMSFKCVAVDPSHPEVVYAGRWAPGKGHSNGIFRSVDYGKTWENITYNLGTEFTVWSISVSPHDGIVYLGSSHGTWKLLPPY